MTCYLINNCFKFCRIVFHCIFIHWNSCIYTAIVTTVKAINRHFDIFVSIFIFWTCPVANDSSLNIWRCCSKFKRLTSSPAKSNDYRFFIWSRNFFGKCHHRIKCGFNLVLIQIIDSDLCIIWVFIICCASFIRSSSREEIRSKGGLSNFRNFICHTSHHVV